MARWHGGESSGPFSTATSRARLAARCAVLDPPTRYGGEDDEDEGKDESRVVPESALELTRSESPSEGFQGQRARPGGRETLSFSSGEQEYALYDDEDMGPMPTITREGYRRRLDAMRQTVAWIGGRWLIRLRQHDVEGDPPASAWLFAALFLASEREPTPSPEDWDHLFQISLAHGVRPGSEVGDTLLENPTGLHRWSWREEGPASSSQQHAAGAP